MLCYPYLHTEFQPPEAPITLVNDTPSVSLAPSGTATVRVDYTLRSDVVSATCGLLEVFGETVCKSYASNNKPQEMQVLI